MALASGVPVPPVFLLDSEQGINAFAAGFSPSDAVVAVTRGCAEQLYARPVAGCRRPRVQPHPQRRHAAEHSADRHPVRHPAAGLIGRMLVRIGRVRRQSAIETRWHGLRAVDRGRAGMVLGFVGTLFGNLIKAAVSRQREYLADASAVQFTRNPTGIAGRLKRIGAAVFGSKLTHPNAAELSHMYFAQGVWEGLSGLFATHPPLGEANPGPGATAGTAHFPPATQADRVADLAAATAAGRIGRTAPAVSRSVPTDVVQRDASESGRTGPTETLHQYARQLIDGAADAGGRGGARALRGPGGDLRFAVGPQCRSASQSARRAGENGRSQRVRADAQAGACGEPGRRPGVAAAGGHGDARVAGIDLAAIPRPSAIASNSWSRPTSGSACSNGRCTGCCSGICVRNSSRCSRRELCTMACKSWAGHVPCCSRRLRGRASATTQLALRPGHRDFRRWRAIVAAGAVHAGRVAPRAGGAGPGRSEAPPSDWSTPVPPHVCR